MPAVETQFVDNNDGDDDDEVQASVANLSRFSCIPQFVIMCSNMDAGVWACFGVLEVTTWTQSQNKNAR